MLEHLKRLLVSRSCYGCERELTSQEGLVCLHCLGQMEATGFHQQPAENEVFYRLGGKVPLAGAASLFYFDKGGTLQRLMEQLKYHNAPRLGEFLGEYYGQHLQGSALVSDLEALVPVPLHRRKQLQRGYNQAEHVARGMGRVLDLPVWPRSLQRRRYTSSQTKKSGQARFDNVAGAFVPHLTQPVGLLLIDDVITTGATLEACIRALYAGQPRPKQVSIASIGLARAY
jgi:ComF family protein